MKKCSTCHETKPEECFSKSSRHKDGLNGVCKECKGANNRKHWAIHKEKTNRQRRERHHTDPCRNIYYQCKARAKREGIPFDLERSDLKLPDVCPVLGIPLIVSEGRPSDNSPTIDKFIPELGYVKGNIAIISYLANRIKTNATTEQVRKVLEWMEYPNADSSNAEED